MKNIRLLLVAGALGGILGACTTATFLGWGDENRVAGISKGYVVPGKFEIHIQDIDLDGKYEAIASYRGNSYLFKVDDSGMPFLTEYLVSPKFPGSRN